MTRLRPGDEVYTDVTTGSGFAGVSCIPADVVERKPANLSFEQAAAVPLAAPAALQGLRDHARVPEAGQKGPDHRRLQRRPARSPCSSPSGSAPR